MTTLLRKDPITTLHTPGRYSHRGVKRQLQVLKRYEPEWELMNVPRPSEVTAYDILHDVFPPYRVFAARL